MSRKKLAPSILVLAWLVAPAALAADDPSIQGDTRSGVKAAMTHFIEVQRSGDGSMLHYDPVSGDLLRLKLRELHAGIVGKGHFYVSCADFVDADGRLVDVDFLVVPSGSGFRVNQALVHAVDGEKRSYHVEQRWPGLF